MYEALTYGLEKNATVYWVTEEHREAAADAGAAARTSAGAGVNVSTAEDAGMLAFALGYAADEIARGEQPSEEGEKEVKTEDAARVRRARPHLGTCVRAAETSIAKPS